MNHPYRSFLKGTLTVTAAKRPPGRLPPWLLTLTLTLAALLLALYSLAGGVMNIPAKDIVNAFLAKISGRPPALANAGWTVLWELRLPRIATAYLAGAALGLSGTVFQGLLMNPLADPYTLGVSSGAAFGAALALALAMTAPGWAFLGTPWLVTAAAFAAALVTLAAVIALARDPDRRLSPTNMILAGVMLSAILSAGLSFIKYLAGDQVASIVFWLLGSFQARTWSDAAVVLVFFLPALGVALASAVDLNIMSIGTRSAETLGVDTRKVRFRLLAAASLAAAAAVSVAGIIGFVGLIVPHLLRMASGPDHRSLLPLSALGGGLLLLAADTVARVVLPGEIPVGVLTALLALPAFLVIFRRRMGGAGYE